MTLLRRFLPALFAPLVLALPALACPFCTAELGRTMIDDFGKADMVLFGSFTNARAGAGFEEGQTDFAIENPLKEHPLVKGKKAITLPKYVNQPGAKFVLFCEVYKGQIDPYRGVPIEVGSELVQYLTGAAKVREKPMPERLAFCFPYLNSKETEVSLDAYREFGNADYKEYKDIASKLDPKILVGWLSDPKTPPYRYGLYSSLLGHCGRPEDGEFLRKLVLDADKHKGSGVDGMLVGSVMIQPKEGWGFLENMIRDTQLDFNTRYACLRAVRFLWGQRPDLVEKKDLTRAMLAATTFPDLADFAIDDLRKWQVWDTTPDILGLSTKKSHDVGVIHRAILRYAIQSPRPEAAKFVAEQRKRDPEQVRDTEEILKLETDVGGK